MIQTWQYQMKFPEIKNEAQWASCQTTRQPKTLCQGPLAQLPNDPIALIFNCDLATSN